MDELTPPRQGAAPGVAHRGALTLTGPGDWAFKESYTLLEPNGRANLIVSSEPLTRSMTAFDYATLQGDLLTTEFRGYVEVGFYSAELPGIAAPCFVREFSWEPPESSPVQQVQLYTVLGDRGITATGTAVRTEFPAYRQLLLDVMSSLTAMPPVSTVSIPTQGAVPRLAPR
jgi:hypothetical protein